MNSRDFRVASPIGYTKCDFDFPFANIVYDITFNLVSCLQTRTRAHLKLSDNLTGINLSVCLRNILFLGFIAIGPDIC